MALRRHHPFFSFISTRMNRRDSRFCRRHDTDLISNVYRITRNAPLYGALESMKFADFAAWSEVCAYRYGQTAMALAVTTILKELTP